MEIDEKDKKLLVIVFILLFTLISLITYHYFSTKKQNEQYEKQKAKEAKEIIKKDEKEKEKQSSPKRGVIISYIKDYMLNNNMANGNDIFIWEVTSVKLYKDENNNYYYTVDGYYKCNEGYDCIDGLVTYPDINGNYDWSMVSEYNLDSKELGRVYSKNNLNLEELEEIIKEVE